MLHLHKKLGEFDGEARQSPRQMEAETLWEGKGQSDWTHWVGSQGQLKASRD